LVLAGVEEEVGDVLRLEIKVKVAAEEADLLVAKVEEVVVGIKIVREVGMQSVGRKVPWSVVRTDAVALGQRELELHRLSWAGAVDGVLVGPLNFLLVLWPCKCRLIGKLRRPWTRMVLVLTLAISKMSSISFWVTDARAMWKASSTT